MLDYQTLDTIADAYIPALGVASIIIISKTATIPNWPLFRTHAAITLCGLLIAYGLMLTDNQLQLWPRFGLDYSTHTAVAFILVIFLSTTARKYRLAWMGSLISYVLLMLYQEYHSLADIVTTALAVSILFLPIVFYFNIGKAFQTPVKD